VVAVSDVDVPRATTSHAPLKDFSGGAMADELHEFPRYREALNSEILDCGHLELKRFFALDHQTYELGALDAKTKELLGLVASMVLRCDDCITCHLVRAGETRAEVVEALNVALVVRGPSPSLMFGGLLRE
jgi:ribonuclease HI